MDPPLHTPAQENYIIPRFIRPYVVNESQIARLDRRLDELMRQLGLEEEFQRRYNPTSYLPLPNRRRG